MTRNNPTDKIYLKIFYMIYIFKYLFLLSKSISQSNIKSVLSDDTESR